MIRVLSTIRFGGNHAPRADDFRGVTIKVEPIPKSFEVNLERLFHHVTSNGHGPKDNLISSSNFGLESTNRNAAKVNSLRGKIGTLKLSINDKPMVIDL